MSEVSMAKWGDDTWDNEVKWTGRKIANTIAKFNNRVKPRACLRKRLREVWESLRVDHAEHEFSCEDISYFIRTVSTSHWDASEEHDAGADPYECPNCGGTGYLKRGFMCRKCDGNGIVWLDEPPEDESDGFYCGEEDDDDDIEEWV